MLENQGITQQKMHEINWLQSGEMLKCIEKWCEMMRTTWRQELRIVLRSS